MPQNVLGLSRDWFNHLVIRTFTPFEAEPCAVLSNGEIRYSGSYPNLGYIVSMVNETCGCDNCPLPHQTNTLTGIHCLKSI
jgi:hypothetical protein